jgi:hypothetical protein
MSSGGADNPAPPLSETQRGAILEVGEAAESIYDAVKVGRWSAAEQALRSLRHAWDRLRSAPSSPASDRQISTEVANLERALAQRRRRPALQSANAMTAIAIEWSATFRTPATVYLGRLDYEGRRLELAAGSSAAVRADIVDRIREIWNKLRPMVIDARATAEAQEFDAIVADLQRIRRAADARVLAARVLDAVDQLEVRLLR